MAVLSPFPYLCKLYAGGAKETQLKYMNLPLITKRNPTFPDPKKLNLVLSSTYISTAPIRTLALGFKKKKKRLYQELLKLYKLPDTLAAKAIPYAPQNTK